MQQNSACAGKNRIHTYFTTLCACFQLNFTDSRRFQAAFSGGTKGSSRNLGGKSSLEARLRTRRVTGRDASLPAPLLTASLGLVGRGTVGALPQTPQGTLSLDPFSRLGWSHFHAPSACSFWGLRLSPCLLSQLSVKNQTKSRPERRRMSNSQRMPLGKSTSCAE